MQRIIEAFTRPRLQMTFIDELIIAVVLVCVFAGGALLFACGQELWKRAQSARRKREHERLSKLEADRKAATEAERQRKAEEWDEKHPKGGISKSNPYR